MDLTKIVELIGSLAGFLGGLASGIFLGLFVNYVSPRFNEWINVKLSRISYWLNPEKFDLTGKWEQEFDEPDPANPDNKRTVKEKIELRHIGNQIKGEGTTSVDPRHFNYKCSIKHSMVFGEYVKKGEKGNISGNGLIQLIVSPDRLSMEGQATWYDNDTKKIESSHSVWHKTR